MKQSFGQKGAGGRFLALVLALIMLCSVLPLSYAAAVDEQGTAEQTAETKVEAAAAGVTYIFYVGETKYYEDKVLSGSVLTKPADPAAPEGKIFKGWFVDNDVNKPFTFGTTVSTTQDETVALYAQFEAAQPAAAQQPEASKTDDVQQPAEQQPEQTGSTEAPKQDETNNTDANTPTGGEENKGEEPTGTENNENQTGENPGENQENQNENTENGGETTTPAEPTVTDPTVPAEPQPTEGENTEAEPLTEEEIAAFWAKYNEIMAMPTETDEELLALNEQVQALADTAKFDQWYATLSEEEKTAFEEKVAVLQQPETLELTGTISSITITDTIETDGKLSLVINKQDGGTFKAQEVIDAGYKITWTMGDTEITRIQVMDGKWTMAEDSSWVNVAYCKGAGKNFTVTVTSADGTETKTASDTNTYNDELKNGSFETPACQSGGDYQPYITGGEQGIVWKTTANDSKIEIVSTRSGAYHNSTSSTHKQLAQKHHNMDHASDGLQYAELNANFAGALYQDVLTEPGSKMFWSVDHNGRWGTDTMAVVVMATKDAETIRTQDQLLTVIQQIQAGNYPGAQVWTDLKGYQGSWTTHEGEYTVPDGQYLTRYFFVAIDTAATGENKDTIGNHIDKVHFSTTRPPVSENKARATVVKKIYGLTVDEVTSAFANKSFIAYNDNTEIVFSGWHTEMDEEGKQYVTASAFYEETIHGSGSATFKFTEDDTKAKVDGYTLQADTEKEKTVTVNAKGEVTVTFTNTYTRSTVKITVKKIIDGKISNPDAKFAFKYSINDVTAEESFELGNGETKEIEVEPNAKLIVWETDPNGYTVSYQIGEDGTWTQAGSDNACTIENVSTEDEGKVITFRNLKDINPDTGLFLDSWPYLIAFALVTAGAVLTLAQRRRRDVD